MLRYIARLAFPLAAFVLVLATSLGFEHSFSPSFNQCVAQHEHDEITGSDNNHPSIFCTVITANVGCSGGFLNRNAGGITALATFIIAAFTGTLWIATTRQARLTEKGVDIANKTLGLQFRPKLIVRNVVVTDVRGAGYSEERPIWFQEGMPVKGQFYIANVGGDSAEVTESGCWVIWRNSGLPMRRPYETKPGNTHPYIKRLKSGKSSPVEFTSDKPMDNSANSILTGSYDWRLYVMGWVQYKDDLGIQRRTAFCRQFNRIQQRFFAIAAPDPDYDYEHAE